MSGDHNAHQNDFKPDWDTVKVFEDRNNELLDEVQRLRAELKLQKSLTLFSAHHKMRPTQFEVDNGNGIALDIRIDPESLMEGPRCFEIEQDTDKINVTLACLRALVAAAEGRDGEQDMTLPADTARCLGYGAAECNTCRRYTDPPHERQTWTGPWELEGVPCEMRIPTQGETDD